MKPCPFCKSLRLQVAEENSGYTQYVYCVPCKASGPIVRYSSIDSTLLTSALSIRAAAIVAWDKRS